MLIFDRRISWCNKKKNENLGYNFDDIVVSKLVKIKNSCKFLIGPCDNVIRPVFSILPKMSGYFKNFKVEDGNKNNK